jgi:hypothetical protein
MISRRFESARPALRDRQPDPLEETADEGVAMMATSRWAVRHYRPGRYAGRTLYLRAAGQVGRRLVWPSFADDLEVVILPGDGHATFLKQENAAVVAEVLDASLREADGG